MDNSRKDAMYLELLTKISQEVRQTQNVVNELDKKLDLSIQKTEFELRAINQLDEQQNQLLGEHIAGVNTLRKILDSTQAVNEARLEKLELPRKFLENAKNAIFWLATVAAGLVAIKEILTLFGK